MGNRKMQHFDYKAQHSTTVISLYVYNYNRMFTIYHILYYRYLAHFEWFQRMVAMLRQSTPKKVLRAHKCTCE